MQRLQGYSRSSKGLIGIRDFKSTCFIKVAIFFLIFLSSCAHKSRNQTLIQKFNKVCLSGEGRGRIEYNKQKIVFSYEDLYDSKKEQWLISLNIPLYGEELLGIDFKDFEKIKIKGNFFNRLKAQSNRVQKMKLKDVINKLSLFLKILPSIKTGEVSCSKGKCKFDVLRHLEYFLTPGALEFRSKSGINTAKLKIKFSKEDEYYKKLEIIYSDEKDKDLKSKQFAMNLFLKSCTETKI